MPRWGFMMLAAMILPGCAGPGSVVFPGPGSPTAAPSRPSSLVPADGEEPSALRPAVLLGTMRIATDGRPNREYTLPAGAEGKTDVRVVVDGPTTELFGTITGEEVAASFEDNVPEGIGRASGAFDFSVFAVRGDAEVVFIIRPGALPRLEPKTFTLPSEEVIVAASLPGMDPVAMESGSFSITEVHGRRVIGQFSILTRDAKKKPLTLTGSFDAPVGHRSP